MVDLRPKCVQCFTRPRTNGNYCFPCDMAVEAARKASREKPLEIADKHVVKVVWPAQDSRYEKRG